MAGPNEGYRAGSSNSVVLRSARRPSSTVGAIGDGLEQVGRAGERIAANEQAADDARAEADFRLEQQRLERARSAAIANGMGAMAGLQVEAAATITELRTNSAPGAEGHEQAVRDALDGRAAAFLATLPDDPEVQERFGPMVAQWAGRALAEETGWELARRAEHQGDNLESWVTVQANAQRRAPDPAAFATTQAQGDALIDAMDIDGTAKAKLRETLRGALVAGHFDGLLNQGNTAAVRTALGDAAFDWMDPRLREGYLNQADTLDRAAAAQAALDEKAVQEAAKNRAAALKVKIEAGEDVPQSEINDTLREMQEAGVPEAEQLEFGYLAEEGVQRRQYRTASTATLEATQRDLQRQADQGKLDGDGHRRLDLLGDLIDERSDALGTELGPLLKGGVESRVQAIAQLAALPVSERWRAAGKAGDTQAAVIAGLGSERARVLAVQGGAIRAARKLDYLPPHRQGETDTEANRIKAADDAFRAILGDDLVRQAGTAYVALRDTALDYMAAQTSGWTPGGFRRAVQAVYGASERSDGTVQGGIGTVRGRTVELPAKWTAAEFDSSMSRFDFADAAYAGGGAANPADVRRFYRPEYARTDADGSTVYRFIGPDRRPLGRKGGGTFEMRLPARPH